MPTGEASGRDIVDEDSYKGGDVTPLQLPPTLTVRTPSVGRHFHFLHPPGVRLPKDNRGKLGEHVDWQRDGAYVVLPPSVSVENGRCYEWTDETQPMAALPAQVVARILAPRQDRESARPTLASTTRVATDGDGAHWLRWALDQQHDGNSDHMGYLLAQQLLCHQVHDPETILHEYAREATHNPHAPFDEGDVQRWLRSAADSDIVQRGEPARSTTSLNGRYRGVDASSTSPRDDDEDGDQDAPEGQSDAEKATDNQQDILLRIADRALLFRTQVHSLPARVEINGHCETWAITERGGAFRQWLIHQCHQMCGRGPNATALTQAVDVIKAKAQFDGAVHAVHTRLAFYRNGPESPRS